MVFSHCATERYKRFSLPGNIETVASLQHSTTMGSVRILICLIILVAIGTTLGSGGRKKNRNHNREIADTKEKNSGQNIRNAGSNGKRGPPRQRTKGGAKIKDEVGDLTRREWPSACKNCGKSFPREIVRDIHEMCCTVSGPGPGHLLPKY